MSPFSAKATHHQSPGIAPHLDAAGHFFNCLDLLIRNAVKETVAESHRQEASPVSAPAIGGIELAQEITSLSKARIYTLVSERGIPVSKRGNKLYFSRADLLAWIGEGKRAVRKNGR